MRRTYLQFSRGHWFAVFHEHIVVDGEERLRRRTRSLGVKGKTKRREAERALMALEQRPGNRDMDSTVSVAMFMDSFLDEVERTVREWTHRMYKVYVGSFVEMHGQRLLCKITPAHIEQWRAMLLSNLAASSVRTYTNCLQGAFRRAVDQGLIHESPFRGIRSLGRVVKAREFPPFWTREQFALFIATVPEGKKRLSFHLAFYAGLRLREASNLRWSDVREDHILITPHGEFKTKSGKSRKVPIAPELSAELSKHARSRGYVLSPDAIPNPDRFTKSFLELRKIYNDGHAEEPLPEITFHGLRHSFATNLAPFVQLPILSKLLGHSDISTTQIYLHVMEDAALEIAAKAMKAQAMDS